MQNDHEQISGVIRGKGEEYDRISAYRTPLFPAQEPPGCPQAPEVKMISTPLLLRPDKSGVPLSRIAFQHAQAAQEYQECLLQEVIDLWPNILPVGDFYPSVTGLCSLGREIPVGIGGGEGVIDNLLITDDGHLVIVETKLWRNPEALRTVIAQTLQYGMAITQISLDQFEGCLRRGDPKGQLLGLDETVVQRAHKLLPGKADDFEDAFDRLRRDGDLLLLIVADGIRSSVERLVEWMNKFGGSAPYKLGLVELGIYELPNAGRIIIPKTLLRTREASRHVVTINLQGIGRETVSATVGSPNQPTEKRKIAAATPLTQEKLAQQIHAKNTPEVAQIAEELLLRLNKSSLKTRDLPSSVQYGVDVSGAFIPLVSLFVVNVWFQIPMRAVRALGEERFVACKQTINQIGNFYRPEDISDPTKTDALGPRYGVLDGKVDSFAEAVNQIAETIWSAVAETEGNQ